MKFYALKEALKKALPPKPQAVVAVPISIPQPRPIPVFPPPNKRELVVGGEVVWKPVDRQAAKLLMRSSWIHQPLPEPTKPIQPIPAANPKQTTETKKPRKRQYKMKGAINESGGSTLASTRDPASGVTEIQGNTFFSQDHIIQQIVDRINKQPGELTELARSALDARSILRENMRELGSGMEDFKAKSMVALEDLRATRMAFVTEAAKLTGPLKDLRQFFLGSDYEQQITRLREFVGLCERLQKLKESGFLDAVADTMLRLSGTPQ